MVASYQYVKYSLSYVHQLPNQIISQRSLVENVHVKTSTFFIAMVHPSMDQNPGISPIRSPIISPINHTPSGWLHPMIVPVYLRYIPY